MTQNTESGTTRGPAVSGLGWTAGNLNRVMTHISNYMAYAGATVLGLLVLMLLYSVIARRAFNSPLKGSMELTELALGLITFLLLAYDSLKGESMIVEIIIDRFPKRSREIIGVFTRLFSVAILGILCWQLIVQGIRVQNFHQTTVILSIPVFPFYYFAGFGILTLIPVHLSRFLISVEKALRK